MAKNRVKIIIGATAKGVKGVFRRITNGLGGIKNAVFSIQGLLAGGGLALLGKSFLDAASTTENFKTRLKVLLGSTEKGNQLFKNMAEYAGNVPFEYEKVMASATALAGVMKGGVKEIGEWMPLIGDLAAASGLSIQESTDQVIRMYSAGAGAADLFRERGILSMLGFQAGVSYSAEETRKKLIETWNDPKSKFKGATAEMADNWDGMVSMLKDAWFSFRTEVMDSGPFQTLKGFIKGLIDQINEFKKSGKFGELAKDFGDKITAGIMKVINALPEMARLIIKAVEYVLVALSGWKQLFSVGSLLFTQVKIWSFEFINQLRLTFIRLMSAMNSLPGVNTSTSIKDTYDDIGTTLGNLDDLETKLEEQKTKLGTIQIEQDAMREKWDKTAEAAKEMMTNITEPAAAAAAAAAGVGEAGAAGMDKAISAADRYIQKLDEIKSKQSLVQIGGVDLSTVDGFSYGDINTQVDQAEKTQ